MGISSVFRGESGTKYTYLLVSHDNLDALTLQAGNFVFARSMIGEPVVIYAGEGANLRHAFTPDMVALWEVARREHSANMILIHIHGRAPAEERHREWMDLVKGNRPPLNASDLDELDQE